MGLAPGPRYEPLQRRGAGGSGEAGMTEMDGAVGDGCGVETFRFFGRSRDDPLPSDAERDIPTEPESSFAVFCKVVDSRIALLMLSVSSVVSPLVTSSS